MKINNIIQAFIDYDEFLEGRPLSVSKVFALSQIIEALQAKTKAKVKLSFLTHKNTGDIYRRIFQNSAMLDNLRENICALISFEEKIIISPFSKKQIIPIRFEETAQKTLNKAFASIKNENENSVMLVCFAGTNFEHTASIVSLQKNCYPLQTITIANAKTYENMALKSEMDFLVGSSGIDALTEGFGKITQCTPFVKSPKVLAKKQ